MNDFEGQIGRRIRNVREKNGLSRERLSEMAEITPKFLYEIEVGRKGMSAYTLFNLSKALNVTCDYLMTGRTGGGVDHIVGLLSALNEDELAEMTEIVRHAAALTRCGKKIIS